MRGIPVNVDASWLIIVALLTWTLTNFFQEAVPGLVASNGHLEGVVDTGALAQYPRQEWDRHTVAEAMRQDLEVVSVPPDADALQALEQMRCTGSSRLLVTDSGRLVGIVSLEDLLRFLQLRLELESGDEDDSGATHWRNVGQREPSAQP